MSDKPLLALCVPTHNRPEALARTLGYLIGQCRPLNVPICVSDNASAYDIDALMAPFRADYPLLSFRRNEKNLGMGANFLKAVEMSPAEYSWLYSDDDSMPAGAIGAMHALCSTRRHALIIANREYMRDDFSKDRAKTSETLEEDLEIPGGDFLLERACVRHFTFIGCLCFKTDLWRETLPERFLHLPYFPHLSIVAALSADPARSTLISAKPLSWVRGGGYSWEKNAGAVWFADLAWCLAATPGYSPEAKTKALSRIWDDIAQYSLWLICKHGKRADAFQKLRAAKPHYKALGAMRLYRLNFLALGSLFLVPGFMLSLARHAWRALAFAKLSLSPKTQS